MVQYRLWWICVYIASRPILRHDKGENWKNIFFCIICPGLPLFFFFPLSIQLEWNRNWITSRWKRKGRVSLVIYQKLTCKIMNFVLLCCIYKSSSRISLHLRQDEKRRGTLFSVRYRFFLARLPNSG